MQSFDNIVDVKEWLAPMGYDAFWDAIAPYGAFGPRDRAHCDRTLAEGISDMQTVVEVIKAWAAWQMTELYDLKLSRYEGPPPRLEVVD